MTSGDGPTQANTRSPQRTQIQNPEVVQVWGAVREMRICRSLALSPERKHVQVVRSRRTAIA